MSFQPFDFERTWWKLFQRHVVPTKLDICTFVSREDSCEPINRFNSPHVYACPKPGPVFPASYVVVIHWDNKRGDCSFCWYLWNWWPSLYHFHNNTSTYRPATTIYVHVTVDINDICIIWIYSIGATDTPKWNIAAISRVYCSELL